MRVLLAIVVPVALIFGCALVLMWLPLPQPFSPALSDGRNRLAAVVTGILAGGYLIALAIWVVTSILGAGRILEPVLTAAGLASESYGLFGQRYRGAIQGRELEVTFLPAQGVAPAKLDVYVAADMGTRLAIGPSRPLLDCRDCPRLDLDGSGLDHFEVYAQDDTYARALLADAGSGDALRGLLDNQGRFGLCEVYVQPDRIWLRARPRALTAERFENWMADLLALAEVGETGLAHDVGLPN
jgi:hypothetical protein